MHNARRHLPSVSAVIDHPEIRSLVEEHSRVRVVAWARIEIDQHRQQGNLSVVPRDVLLEKIVAGVLNHARQHQLEQVGRVINATGIVLHTGLGRAVLSAAAREALQDAAGCSNVEVELASGQRRHRGYQIEQTWKLLTGCEDCLIVNNNAAATLLTLQALCRDQQVVISRGQLIEIGGSFRLPEIFELSGAQLAEVGTTNRTTVEDYAAAMNPDTAAIMRVHPSNYRVVGFAETPGTPELVQLARRHQTIMIDDIGSGSLIDAKELGLPDEPTFGDSLKAGADLVLGSGDKLLGGPQCGIILGSRDLIETLRNHPLARTVRVDKLTLAALAATLEAYLGTSGLPDLPIWRMLSVETEQLEHRATQIIRDVGSTRAVQLSVEEARAAVGGGSLPAVELPTVAIAVKHAAYGSDQTARRLRTGSIRIMPRVQQDRTLIDLRSVLPEDDSRIALALRLLDAGETE